MFNKKLCYYAFDSLNECVSQQSNENKYRCPDQLYAYDQWCPPAFQAVASHHKYKTDLENFMYDKDAVAQINREKSGTSEMR